MQPSILISSNPYISGYEDIGAGTSQNRWKGKNGNSVARENGWTVKEEVKEV